MLDPQLFKSYDNLVRMHEWLTEAIPDDLLSAPELSDYTIAVDQTGLLRLVGQVSCHPRLGDRWITTSPIWQIDPQGTRARTSNRWYRLAAAFRDNLKDDANPKAAVMAEQFLLVADAIAHLGFIQSIVERELGKRTH